MTSETVLNERPAESTSMLALEISEELEQALRSEHVRLSGEANPTPIEWDRFMEATLVIGLDELKRIPALEALEKLENLEWSEA